MSPVWRQPQRTHSAVRLSAARNNRHGFTLVETIFSMCILLIIGLGVIGGIVYTRQSMELDKQKLAALNYCRRTMEAAMTYAAVDSGRVTLVPFNAPGLEIAADVNISYFPINTDGSIKSTAVQTPNSHELTLCRVTVNWVPAGRWSRPQQVSAQSIIVGSMLNL